MRDAIRVRHYSIRTEQAYTGWIRRFTLDHGKRHPAEMGAAEVTAFLSWFDDLVRAKRPVRLPHALSRKYPRADYRVTA